MTAPSSPILKQFGQFIDGIELYHYSAGDVVTTVCKPLWQFSFDEMANACLLYDRVYFPHKLRSQFPIGDNAFFYKNAPLNGYFTADPDGWGASLSFLPPALERGEKANHTFNFLKAKITENESIFAQPAQGAPPASSPYDLFICQLPHDETIKFHSQVSVEDALTTTLLYARETGRTLVVKGHPANPKSMLPLQKLTLANANAKWVDHISIHTCFAGAERVFLVNSGSGMEALLHDTLVVRFGHAEYDCVTPQSAPNVADLTRVAEWHHDREDYAAFLHAYLQRCIKLGDVNSYARVLS
ncbi:hypothetical protein [Asticcacaulis sp. MM231]|uniref:capsular polysaccharide export protein, LipB/KpsS family n=1 Tax=Asticcacaulis sp. MM231 TaxID=3157666 RepID=UPI0032D57C22